MPSPQLLEQADVLCPSQMGRRGVLLWLLMALPCMAGLGGHEALQGLRYDDAVVSNKEYSKHYVDVPSRSGCEVYRR